MTSIVRLQQLNEQATPGPWRFEREESAGGEPSEAFVVADEKNRQGFALVADLCSVPNADLIVECRNALPVLLQIATAAERVVELALAARGQAAAPDYDEEAIRDALWRTVNWATQDLAAALAGLGQT